MEYGGKVGWAGSPSSDACSFCPALDLAGLGWAWTVADTTRETSNEGGTGTFLTVGKPYRTVLYADQRGTDTGTKVKVKKEGQGLTRKHRGGAKLHCGLRRTQGSKKD